MASCDLLITGARVIDGSGAVSQFIDIISHHKCTGPNSFGHYVREKKLFDLETAVHKMTGLTASRFGLENRGTIAIGNYADLGLFDPDTIIDRASFADPAQFSEGIISVWVNGQLSWHEQKSTGTRQGRFLTH